MPHVKINALNMYGCMPQNTISIASGTDCHTHQYDLRAVSFLGSFLARKVYNFVLLYIK